MKYNKLFRQKLSLSICTICISISYFQTFFCLLSTSAPVRADVLVHIIEVVIELLDPVGITLCAQDELLLIVEVLGVPDEALVGGIPLGADLLVHAVTLIPNLQGTSC